MKKYLMTGLAMVILAPTIKSQDNHYWWQNYGGESSMLSGCVIAGVRDNSAVFYNPGALGFIGEASVSVNANVYMAQLTRIMNGVGDGLDLKQWRYTYYPQMISGMLQFEKMKKWKFGYTLMTRYNSYYRFNHLEANRYDIYEQIPGEEAYVATYEYYNEIDEQWGGLGASYNLGKHVSVGVSAFASYRDQFFQQVLNARSVPNIDSIALLQGIGEYDNIKYINWKLIFKIGLALDYEKLRAGITLTTPSLDLYGDADVQREISLVNFGPYDNASGMLNLMLIDRQASLPINNKSPLSIAAGVQYKGSKTRIELSAEYFFGIKPYRMIRAEARPFVYPPQLVPEEIQSEYSFLSIYNYANPVLNAGLGLGHDLSEKASILCGFRTDFNFQRSEKITDGYLIPTGSWDLYHITAGLSYSMKSSKLTAGLDYYFGWENNQPQVINLSDPKDYLGYIGAIKNNSDIRIHGIAAVIGFTYFFSEKSSLPF